MIRTRSSDSYTYSRETLSSFRTVASQLWHQWHEAPFKVLLVTSSVRNEGKSFFSYHLAESLSLDFDRILLIHYADDMTINKAAEQRIGDDPFERISLITPPEGPSEGVSFFKLFSERNLENTRWLLKHFDEIAGNAERQFDIILLDFPSLNEDIFPFELLDQIDKIILVVRANHTRKRIIADSLKRLDDHREKLAGIVINRRKEYIPKMFLSSR
jgi:Mrp family chromosome partitioning ATPase